MMKATVGAGWLFNRGHLGSFAGHAVTASRILSYEPHHLPPPSTAGRNSRNQYSLSPLQLAASNAHTKTVEDGHSLQILTAV